MPISIQEIKEYEIHNILSSTKEDLEKLTDTELTTISDIIRCRKLNKDVNLYIIQNLLDSVHFLIMQEETRLRKEEEKSLAEKELEDSIRNGSVESKFAIGFVVFS